MTPIYDALVRHHGHNPTPDHLSDKELAREVWHSMALPDGTSTEPMTSAEFLAWLESLDDEEATDDR